MCQISSQCIKLRRTIGAAFELFHVKAKPKNGTVSTQDRTTHCELSLETFGSSSTSSEHVRLQEILLVWQCLAKLSVYRVLSCAHHCVWEHVARQRPFGDHM
jgi:hypothetical protein